MKEASSSLSRTIAKVAVDEREPDRRLRLERGEEGQGFRGRPVACSSSALGLLPRADVGGGADDAHQPARVVEHRSALISAMNVEPSRRPSSIDGGTGLAPCAGGP